MSFLVKEKMNQAIAQKIGGSRIYKNIITIADYYYYCWEVVSSIRKIKNSGIDAFIRVLFKQIYFTGVNALVILGVIALLIGGTTIIQAVTFLPKLGQESFIGNLLKFVIVREVGPLITAIIILTRSGSAIATELATQKLNKELEALQIMGINPYLMMIIPRVIGGLVATMLLIVYFDFIAFIGGYLISQMLTSIPFNVFLETVIRSLSLADIFATILKGMFYGFFITTVCSFYGLKAETLFQIPIFVSRAVVRSLFIVFMLNGFLSAIFYL